MTATSISENALLSLMATVVIGLTVLVGWCAGGAASDFVAAHRNEAEAVAAPRSSRIPLEGVARSTPAGTTRAAPARPVKTRREAAATDVPAATPQFEARR